jgi:hypothetical protein
MPVAASAPVLVSCANCDPGTPWWQIAIAATSVLLAVVALVVALRALKYTADQHAMTTKEHKHFLAEMARKPDLRIVVHFKPERTTYKMDTNTWLEVVVGVHNAGERTVDSGVVNVLFPADLNNQDYLKRLDANGYETLERPQTKGEPLSTSDGGQVETCFFHWTGQQYVAGIHTVHRFRFPVDLVDTPKLIPVRVKITSEQGTAWEETVELRAEPAV